MRHTATPGGGERLAALPPLGASVIALSARLFEPRSAALRAGQVALVTLLGLVTRLVFIQSPGYHDDIVIFFDWFKAIGVLPLDQVYAHVPGLNYPPMIVVFYRLESIVFGWFVSGTPSEYALNIAIKLPPILLDAAGTVLVYTIARRFAPHRLALLAGAFIAFNPAIIYDSAFWGQNDVVPTVLALFAIAQLRFGSTLVAWLCITAAAFFKPPVLVLVPLLLLDPLTYPGPLRRRAFARTAIGVIASLVVAELLAFTFFEHRSPLWPTRALIAQYVHFSNVFSYTSLSAFNIWALFAPFFTSDKSRFLGLTLHVWGDLAFVATAAAIYWRYLRRRTPAAIFEAAVLLLLGFFVILTEMHERYLFYAVFFCAVLVFRKPYRNAAVLLSLVLVLNLEYGLTFMYLDDAKATVIDRFQFAPWLIHIGSLLNIGVFAALLWSFMRTKAGSPESAGTATAGGTPAAPGHRIRSSQTAPSTVPGR